MKNVWIAFLLVVLVSSCLPEKIGKKDKEPELAGVYQITSFVSNGITLIPQPGVSGTVNVVKNSDTQISVSFSVNNNGKISNNISPLTLSISKSSGSSYDLLDNGDRIGSIDGTTFSLYFSNSESLSAKK
ncbi:hypothetical protein GCM10028803_10690 [Larkinella knui]|uniref:Lipocalin-like domain-containing protein n=1 Tax=Larkinella knui TaxID=2025310 RepID=A0A3P1CDP7_9BACT|nr:hypothetical protein [Larkinella knui]RRB10964.1 hypothetical protein EHT87_27870 [Larkinella knui]